MTMLVHLNWKNFGVFCVALFFAYLIFMLWSAGGVSEVYPDVEVDLKDVISYAMLSSYRGSYAVRKIHEKKMGSRAVKGKTDEGAKEFVTFADLVSNAVITETFSRFPGVTVISEERSKLSAEDVEPYRTNAFSTWEQYKKQIENIQTKMVRLSDINMWIDPLDATQEYTEDLLQYVSVMICITVNAKPVFGVIQRPFENETVWGYVGHGVYPELLPTVKKNKTLETIVVSRSHSGKVKMMANAVFTEDKPEIDSAGGSGFKMLRVLNNTADAYIHVTAIKKWDICAGQAIIEAAGGHMTSLDGEDITYFPKDNPKINKGLLVTRRNHFALVNRMTPYITGAMKTNR